MRLLDRYLLRELLVPFSYCLSGFLVFWISFDLLSELADFQQQRLAGGDITRLYLFRSPEFIVRVLPVAFLLALLYALTNHARHQEFTAIRAAGVSMWRLALPYSALGLLLGAMLFWVNETWVPVGADAAEQVLNRHHVTSKNPRQRNMEYRFGFRNARENRNWVMGSFNLLSFEMVHPHVSWFLPDGSRRELFAERATREDGVWVFTNVQMLVYPPGQGQPENVRSSETNRLAMPEFSETPEDIKADIKVRKIGNPREARRTQLSIQEIVNYQRLHPDEIEKRAVLETKLHGRFAAPWTCVVVVLIALPFGMASGRRNVFVGVASSIIICFGFFTLSEMGLALGARGTIPAWLAAWGPNLVFGLGGAILIWRTR